MTTPNQIDNLIQKMRDQLNVSTPTVDERIQEMRRQLSPQVDMVKNIQEQLVVYQEPPSQEEQIDNMIKSLQKQLNDYYEHPIQEEKISEFNESYSTKIEKAIDEEKNIISRLIDEQLKYQTRMEELQEIQQLMQL